MARRYRRYRSRRALKSVKYANETRQFHTAATWDSASSNNTQFLSYQAVPSTDIQGMRKVKNFTLQIQAQTLTQVSDVFNWALVYVPFGQQAGHLNIGISSGQSYYEPNQNVIISGVGSFQNGLVRRSRLARNLNSGDQIVLLVAITRSSAATTYPLTFYINGILNYAITYN